jgi:acyl-CoA hydrolase
MGSGGVPVLIRAMSANPDSPEIAEAAGSVLVAVAKQGDEGEKAVGKEGRAALAEASKNFPEVSYYDWLVSWF